MRAGKYLFVPQKEPVPRDRSRSVNVLPGSLPTACSSGFADFDIFHFYCQNVVLPKPDLQRFSPLSDSVKVIYALKFGGLFLRFRSQYEPPILSCHLHLRRRIWLRFLARSRQENSHLGLGFQNQSPKLVFLIIFGCAFNPASRNHGPQGGIECSFGDDTGLRPRTHGFRDHRSSHELYRRCPAISIRCSCTDKGFNGFFCLSLQTDDLRNSHDVKKCLEMRAKRQYSGARKI